jgi:transposase
LYKDGDQGAETFRYAFDDTRDSNNNVTRSAKDKTQAVLILTNNEATNPNYQYQIPNLNCVDQLLLAMKAGDLPKPDSTIDCRRKYEFKYKYRRQSGSFNTVYFRFQLSIPKYLIKELKKDKNIKDVLVHF